MIDDIDGLLLCSCGQKPYTNVSGSFDGFAGNAICLNKKCTHEQIVTDTYKTYKKAENAVRREWNDSVSSKFLR